MSVIETRLRDLGLTLPPPKTPVANYLGTKQSGDLLFVSGRVSQRRGEVGTELSLDEAKLAARDAMLDLLAIVKPKAAAQHVIFHSYDTYTTNVPLADFSADDVMLAWNWNGEPISREHGGPLRVVIPKLYFWKSAKWIKRIEFSVHDKPGFWEVRGYHNYGDPWLEQRYDEE